MDPIFLIVNLFVFRQKNGSVNKQELAKSITIDAIWPYWGSIAPLFALLLKCTSLKGPPTSSYTPGTAGSLIRSTNGGG